MTPPPSSNPSVSVLGTTATPGLPNTGAGLGTTVLLAVGVLLVLAAVGFGIRQVVRRRV